MNTWIRLSTAGSTARKLLNIRLSICNAHTIGKGGQELPKRYNKKSKTDFALVHGKRYRGKSSHGIFSRSAKYVGTRAPTDSLVDCIEIAFIGKSNVGKSSLLSKLFRGQRKSLVRTSKTPGCTKTSHFYFLGSESENLPALIFVDLPGYGYAKTSKKQARYFKDMTRAYFRESLFLSYTCLLVDSRRGISSADLEMAHDLERLGRPFQLM